MLSSLLGHTQREFGVVRIERGSEVGGGEARFGVGTVARIASVEIADGSIGLLATGGARFEVMRWFFFQAEDGIRDIGVTGVQTCALPISTADLPGIGARIRMLSLATA